MSLFRTAATSIDCALYDVNLPSWIDALSGSALPIRVVTERKNVKGSLPPSFILDNNFYLMHNKFCVIDGHILITGSMNPTRTDALRNHNNLLIVDSSALSSIFLSEAKEMQSGTYGGGASGDSLVLRNGYLWDVRFCPEQDCRESLLERLEQAARVDGMIFPFTGSQVGLRVASLGNNSRVLLEKRQSRQRTSVLPLLLRYGVQVKEDNTSATLHHKVFILDNSSVFFGSYNPTRAANEGNDEALIYTNDATVVAGFISEFERLWEMY